MFWIGNDPPPFRLFPKKHPNLDTRSSLTWVWDSSSPKLPWSAFQSVGLHISSIAQSHNYNFLLECFSTLNANQKRKILIKLNQCNLGVITCINNFDCVRTVVIAIGLFRLHLDSRLFHCRNPVQSMQSSFNLINPIIMNRNWDCIISPEYKMHYAQFWGDYAKIAMLNIKLPSKMEVAPPHNSLNS